MNTSALILTIFLFLGSVYFGLGIIEKIKFLTEKQNSMLGIGSLLALLPLLSTNFIRPEIKKEEQN